MELFNTHSLLQLVCKTNNKYGMYISICDSYYDTSHFVDHVCESAPYLDWKNNEHLRVIADGQGFLLFDSYEEMDDCFRQTRGDNKISSGQIAVYALTCSNEGELLTSNT